MEELSIGALFAGHRIEGIAGRGGMGVVYRARDLRLERLVALKVIAPELSGRADQRARFVSESRSAAALDHPNVVPVLYAGEESGTAFIAMRFVDGRDLRSLVRQEGPLEPRRAVSLLTQVAAALDAAHARGLIHRDVKPGNVLVGEHDRASLTDFGLSKQIGSTDGATRSSDWVGTLDYVAPEMITGGAVTHRADVYALGAMLFYLLTARVPYPRERDEAILWAHVHEPPPRPSVVQPGVPPGLDDVVGRAMAKEPRDRYASAGQLAGAAAAALVWRDGETGSGGTGVTRVLGRPAERGPRRRSRGLVAASALLVAFAAAALAVLATSANHETPTADASPTPTAIATPALAQHPATARVLGKFTVGERPADITFARGRAWVISSHASTLPGIDLTRPTNSVNIAGIPLGSSSIAAGFGRVWLANRETNQVFALDPRTRRIRATITVPVAPQVVRAGFGAVWTVSRTDPVLLSRIDPKTATVTRSVPLPLAGRSFIDAGHGSLWIVSSMADDLLRVDPQTMRVTGRRYAGDRVRSVAVGHGAVWIASPHTNAVARIGYGLRSFRSVPVGNRPTKVIAGPAGVWVSNYDDGTVMRIDPKRRRVVGAPVHVGRGAFAMACTRDKLWVTLVNDNLVARLAVAHS